MKKCEILRGIRQHDTYRKYLWEKFRRELKTTFGLSRQKPRDRFVQQIKLSKMVVRKMTSKNILQSTYLKWIKVINFNRNKDMTLPPKRSTHKRSDLYWTMFARQSSHLSVNKTERVLFVPFLSFIDLSQFQTLRMSQGRGTRFCVQMISLDETWRNNYENWLKTFLASMFQ